MSNPYGWGQNEPQIKPKDQGGDTIATFSQKIYNLFDNLFNTLNSYPWSAATQSDAGYMSAVDKAALDNVPTTYLPLLGGTLSNGTNSLSLIPGAIEISASQPFIDFHHANSTVDHTARIINDEDGRLLVSVQNDTNTQSKSLNLNIDGNLTWDGKDVACFANFSSGASGYARFTNGLQLCWSYDNIPEATKNSGKAITYALPFSSVPRLMLSLRPGSAHTSCDTLIAYPTSSTGATIYLNNPNGRSFGQFSYLAVGTY